MPNFMKPEVLIATPDRFFHKWEDGWLSTAWCPYGFGPDNAEIVTEGFLWRASAPCHMDATDWTYAETFEDLRRDLEEHFDLPEAKEMVAETLQDVTEQLQKLS